MYHIARDEFDNYFVVDPVRLIHEPLPLTWFCLTKSEQEEIANQVYRDALYAKIDIKNAEIQTKCKLMEAQTKINVSRLLIEGNQPFGYSCIEDDYTKEDEKMMWEPGLSEPKKKLVYSPWKEKYKDPLQHLPFKENIFALLNQHTYSSSSWVMEGPILVGGFLGYVVETYKVKDALDAIMSSPYIEDVSIPYIATSQYSAPSNVSSDRLHVIASDNKFQFSDVHRGSRTVLIALDITTSDQDKVNLIIACDSITDVIQYFGDNFERRLKAKQLEKFIHSCKKNVMEKYDPSLSYTKIDDDLVGELC